MTGSFTTINGVPAGYFATINYGFSGSDSTGRIGDGNDIAVTVVPEPTSLGLIALAAASLLGRRRRRRAGSIG